MPHAGLQLRGDAAFRCLGASLQGRRRTAGSAGGSGPPLSPGLDNFAWGSVVPEGPLQLDSEFERRLATGACIACRLRGAVRQELGERAMLCVCWMRVHEQSHTEAQPGSGSCRLQRSPAGCSALWSAVWAHRACLSWTLPALCLPVAAPSADAGSRFGHMLAIWPLQTALRLVLMGHCLLCRLHLLCRHCPQQASGKAGIRHAQAQPANGCVLEVRQDAALPPTEL